MKIVLIGDPHLDFETCKKSQHTTLVLGDMVVECEADLSIIPKNIRFFHGNHDNPCICPYSPQYLGKFGFFEDKIFFASGAASVDKNERIIGGLPYFSDEEMSYTEMVKCAELYEKIKPEIVATHEAPWLLVEILRAAAITRSPRRASFGKPPMSRTQNLLDHMYRLHQPKLWVFGHWHLHLEYTHEKTRFVCLDRTQPYLVETDDYYPSSKS